jgi:hypothetical protein
MASSPCSQCGERIRGPAASVYVAWFVGTGERVCYKMRYCYRCVARTWALILKAEFGIGNEAADFSWCSVCGTGTPPEELDPVYVTLYLPKQERQDLSLQTHWACAAKLRQPVQENGILQPNRQGGMRGPSSSPDNDWGSLVPA